MTSYPNGRFIQEFARRTVRNMSDIEGDRPISYEDTALIGFLLAVFVLPHERGESGKYMADILRDYGRANLEEVVKILRPKEEAPDSKHSDEGWPKSLADIPKFMRHAIAHLNIKPESADGQDLTHLLVWNRPRPREPINFVARVDVQRLRSLARHVLERLSNGASADKYEQIDPVAEYDKFHA